MRKKRENSTAIDEREDSSINVVHKELTPLAVLSHFAQVSPESIAIVNEIRRLNFSQLNIVVRQFALKFQQAGIKPGDFVVTKLPTVLDWISTLALISIGAITSSKAGRAPINPALNARFLISDGSLVLQGAETIIINDSWLHQAEQLDPNQLSEENLDDLPVSRVLFTNGTMSNPKAVGLSLKALTERANHTSHRLLHEKSVMTPMDLSSTLGFLTFYSLFLRGEKIVTTSQFNSEVLQMAITEEIEVVVASTFRCVQLMEMIESNKSTLPTLRKVIISGNIPTLSLLKKISETLSVEVANIYGSAECGDISSISFNSSTQSGDMGLVYPNVLVEIRDASGEPVDHGKPGRIATQTSTMVHEYFRAPVPNRTVFEKGWFFSGEIGYINESGHLVVTGRDSEIITVGKLKVNSQTIEEHVLDYAGVIDCAAFAFISRFKKQALGVAIVGDQDLNLKRMATSLRQELGEIAPKTYFVTDSIPRDANGKLETTKLLAELKAKIAEKQLEKGGAE